MRLQDVSTHVRIAKDRELANFMEYLMYEVAQLCGQLDGAGWMMAEEGGRVNKFKLTKHEEREAWETLKNTEAQLDVVKIDFDIRRSAELGMVAEGTKLKRKGPRSRAGEGEDTQRTGRCLPSTTGTH